MTTFPPTPEQSAILDAFRTGSNMVIQAGAGTGKTTTIEMLANDMAQRGAVGTYITLNKSVAADVGSRFIYGNVSSSTIHSLAYHVGRTDPRIAPLLDKLNAENPVSRMNIARHLGVEQVVSYTTYRESNRESVGLPSRPTTATSLQLCHAALDALRVWCQTDEDTLTTEHVNQPATMPDDQFAEKYAPVVAEIAVHAWTSDILSVSGRLPFTHDYYLKLVSLSRPSLTRQLGAPQGSVIFFDEAQDSRPCVTRMLHDQADMQLITVGDSAQAIYGSFTGARDALPKFSARPETITLPLTTSWRFGPGIADAANHTLSTLDAPIRLTGNPDPELGDSAVLEVTDPDNVPATVGAVLVRSNSRLIFEAERQMVAGRRVHIATDVWALLNIIRDFQRIESGTGKPLTPELREFTGGMPQILDYVNDSTVDAGNATKALLARFIEEGVEPTENVISASVAEGEADVVVSTIHKSKGRQWNQVYLAFDPEEIVPGVNPRLRVIHDPGTTDMTFESRESLMLYYVALTRARHTAFVPRATTSALDDLYTDHARRRSSGARLLTGD